MRISLLALEIFKFKRSHNNSMGIFPDAHGQLTIVNGWILANFELIQDFMVVLVTCKDKEDQTENEDNRVAHNYNLFFRCSRAANSFVSGRIWSKCKLIQALMKFFAIWKKRRFNKK